MSERNDVVTNAVMSPNEGRVMRRGWSVMDCVIIQPWRCRSLERNGLLCLLLLCQCNHGAINQPHSTAGAGTGKSLSGNTGSC